MSNTDVAELGYERPGRVGRRREDLELAGLDLDESLALWERGEALAKRCDEHLAGARKRVADALAHADDVDEDDAE